MTNSQPSKKYVELLTDNFGFLSDKTGTNVQIKRFTWKNSNKIQVQLITYGATIISVRYPNKKGILEDVVPGFEELQPYMDYSQYYFGSTIGRNANILRNATFCLNKREYPLTTNAGKHHFNGGKKGLHQVIWNHMVSGNKVILSYLSPDGDEGYPGDLLIFATYELTSQNEFKVEYRAMSSKSTIVNLAHHVYFNLAGHAAGPQEVNNHVLTLNADCYTVTGEDKLPTGEIQSVLHTDYDFQTPTRLGPLLDRKKEYNNNFCVNRGIDQGINFVARLYHPVSGRIVEVYSNQYGVQLETANNLPPKCEPEELNIPQKIAKSPYLRSGVVTFDMLDEIFNKVAEIRLQDPMNDYEDVLNVVQELQKKSATVYRNTTADGNAGIKRSALTIESLPVFQLTPLQIKFLERILKSINSVKDPTLLLPIKTVIQTTICNNKVYQESVINSGIEKRKNENPHRVIRGKRGSKYCQGCAISIQSQNYPDAINNPKFPNPILKPGNTYNHTIIYKFWIKTDQSGLTGII